MENKCQYQSPIKGTNLIGCGSSDPCQHKKDDVHSTPDVYQEIKICKK